MINCKYFVYESADFVAFLACELTVVEMGVKSVLGEELSVIALLDDLAVTHDQNRIGRLNGGESVRNDKGCSSLHHGIKSLLNADLGAGIDRRSCLIQNQDRRQTQHHSCDTKQLLLSLR